MENVCIIGGAQGADSMFALCASEAGHHVKHYVFYKHGSKCEIGEHIDVVTGRYKELSQHLKIANEWLDRNLYSLSDYSRNLLFRNMAIALDTETAMYAIANLVDDKVAGGTAWAVTRANQMMTPVYIYNQLTGNWHSNDFEIGGLQFPVLDGFPPKPTGIYGAVGSRELTESGINAIKSLYNGEIN